MKKFYVWYHNFEGKKVTFMTIESNKTKQEIKKELLQKNIVFDGVDVVK